mgnify:CR=1 FL=1
MALIGNDFITQIIDREFRCSECGITRPAGHPWLTSIRGKSIRKRVCSEECRLQFDDRFWQHQADKHVNWRR